MYLDTTHNSLPTVHKNISSAYTESAIKMMAYIKCLAVAKKPKCSLVIKTVGDVLELGWCLSRRGRANGVKREEGIGEGGNGGGDGGGNGKGKGDKYAGYKCDVSKAEMRRLGLRAFLQVMRRRQSGYGGVVKWLEGELKGKGKGRV